VTPIVRRTDVGVLALQRFLSTETSAALLAHVRPEEAATAAAWGERRRRTFAMGRLAAREALAAFGADVALPILPDDRGAPCVPAPLCLSLSHKDEVAAALVAASGAARVGVDVEPLTPREHARDIAAHVLTEAERAELLPLDEDARRREVLVRFALKEALYKALDPFVRRYVGFLEVEVRPHGDDDAGELEVVLTLPAAERGAYRAEGRLLLVDELAVALVRVAPM
jgi:4'-phosphopantetheinyl transferase EntD